MEKGKVGSLSSMGSKSKLKVATEAGASQMVAKHFDFSKKQDKFPLMVKSKRAGVYSSSADKKMKTVSRRSQRIMNLSKPVENQNCKPLICELGDSGSETEVELGVQFKQKSPELTINPQRSADGDGTTEREEKASQVKKTRKVVNNLLGLNEGVPAAGPNKVQLINIAEKTQELEKSSGLAQKQEKAPVLMKAKHASKFSVGTKMRTGTRRSQRITNLAKPAENQNNEPQACDLDDSGSEMEVELGAQIITRKTAEPVIEPHGSAGGGGRKEKEEGGRKVKKTQEVVGNPRELNGGVAAGRTNGEQRANNAEKTQEVGNNPPGLNNGAAATGSEEEPQVNRADKSQEVVAEPIERLSSQNASDRESRYKTLYIKSMRRLDAVTEERKSLNRELAWAQAKLGVLHDFRDQISELTEKLDIANGRLEVYQKTMNPQMVDMLRDFLTSTNQSQTAEVPQNTSSEKDTGMRRATKPRNRGSKKRKASLK